MIHSIYFPPEINRDFILSRVSEEEIFNRYGLFVQKGSFCSTLRIDRKPTCNFYHSRSDRLYYKDWGQADHHFDCIGFVSFQFGLQYYQTLRKIAEDFSLIKQEGERVKAIQRIPQETQVDIQTNGAPEIRILSRTWDKRDSRFWGRWMFSRFTLDFYEVKPLAKAWLNSEPIFHDNGQDPAYAYYLGKGYKYKLYFPYRKEWRFLHNVSEILQGENQLVKSIKEGKFDKRYLVVTKSLKDVMKLYEFNIPAVAPMSETTFPIEALERLKNHFKTIYCLYDLDKGGIPGMKRLRDEFKFIPLWIPRVYMQKDFTDLYEAVGSIKISNLINKYKDYDR